MKKFKTVTKTFRATYVNSVSRSGESHSESWRKKYMGELGVIYIIVSDYKQYFQWHPLVENKVLFSKGILSSNDDYELNKNKIKITTENSIYYFQIINSNFKIPQPKLL